MQAIDRPNKIAIPFASGGIKREIPNESQIGIVDGAASFVDGFPPKTFQPVAVGGVPPAGADFNGVLNRITAIQRWQSAGGTFGFDATFAAAIGGYPKGATLAGADPTITWTSTVESNSTDPDDPGASGWVSLSTSNGSNLVGFVQTGASAKKRPTQDKLRDVVSLFDYMLAPDIAAIKTGVYGPIASVHGACQDAINTIGASVSKGVILAPAGEYHLTTALQIPYGVSLRGAGATATNFVCYGCGAINFTSYGYQIGSMFVEDIGFTVGSGTNQTAITTAANASTMDGLYFDRLRFYGWNECFNFAANWNCSIEGCVAQNVNSFIAISGVVVSLAITNNRAVYAAGGAGTAVKAAVELRGGTIQESIRIHGNYFYGFDFAISARNVAVFMNIVGNDLSSIVEVISFTTVNGIFNITDNYIEAHGVGVMGQAQSVQTPTIQVNIERNGFVGTGGAATIGLQLNTGIGTNQFDNFISRNNFNGFSTHDVKLFSPGKSRVEKNRCMSTGPTNSMHIGGVIAGPVVVKDNWCNKLIYVDVPADIENGKLVLQDNQTSNTFVPYQGSFAPAYVPAAGAFGAITYGKNVGQFNRIGDQCFFSLEIYTTAAPLGTASGLLYIDVSGIPFMPRAGVVSAVCPIGDNRLWAAGKGPSVAAVVANSRRLVLYTRSTANGDNALLNAVDLNATNPGNLVTISGSYLCA